MGRKDDNGREECKKKMMDDSNANEMYTEKEGRAAPVLARCCGGPPQAVFGDFEGISDD